MTKSLTVFNSNTNIAESQDDQLWNEVNRIFAGFNIAAAAKELGTVFNNLHDDELLESFEKTRWTGRPGYPLRVMWRTLVTSYILDIPTIQELIRTLRRNPFIAIECGIYSDKGIPSRFAYYRFIKKLLAHRDLIEKCMAKTVAALQKQLPDFGKTIAVDSTAIPTYANKYRKPHTDCDAKWGAKSDRDGKPKYWLGYKLHLVADAKYEIPLIPIITPANENDTKYLIPSLEKNRALIKGFSPNYVLADKGYDANENYRVIVEDFGATPIIDMIRRKKAEDEWKHNADYLGTPYCIWNEPMTFWGYDKKRKILKYRCPYSTGKGGCTWLEKCSRSNYGRVLKIKIERDYRRFCQVPRHTKRWRELYNQRTSVERIFSRLKRDGDGRLVNHRMRGLDKITMNCLLSVYVMQTRACCLTGSE